MKHGDRRSAILQESLLVAEKYGYQNITRAAVAKGADVSESLIQYHFNTIQDLKTAVIEEALRVENLRILAQAFTHCNAIAWEASRDLRMKVLEYMNRSMSGDAAELCPACGSEMLAPKGVCSSCPECGALTGGE